MFEVGVVRGGLVALSDGDGSRAEVVPRGELGPLGAPRAGAEGGGRPLAHLRDRLRPVFRASFLRGTNVRLATTSPLMSSFVAPSSPHAAWYNAIFLKSNSFAS